MANRLKEDEKNERIIRNLLKLPENRKCINCNSLGPQYVCTNFSTFICTTCSGIHREFTHRVKSVSMAKFTPQEVSSLQGGGNASAREIYLKEWDSQRNSLPDASNTERLRDFIKHIYVQRRYTGERNSEKPLRAKMRTASSSSLASSEGNPSVIKVEASFIDFDSVPEPAATTPQTQHSATNAAPVQQIAPSDNNWANFDSFSEVKFPTPVSNSVESLLSELSIEVSTSAPPAPTSKLSPFYSSGSENSALGSTYGSVTTPSMFPSDGTSSFANTPTGGQWPIPNSHQDSMFPGASGLSVPKPVATISATSSDKPFNPLVGPISLGHPGAAISRAGQAMTNPSMGSAFGFSSESTVEEKFGGRRELPADLFTTNSYFPPPVSGWYSGSPYVARGPMQYNMPMVVPSFQQVPRSTNPFDSTNERPPVPAPTFPSGASLHGSVAKSPPASSLLRASSLGTLSSFPSSKNTQPPPFAQSIPPTPFFGQELSASNAHRPFGSNQQFGGLHSAHSAPGNFTSTGGNPFG